MNLSINIKYLQNKRNTSELRTIRECGEICKKSGFNLVDYSFASLNSLSNEILNENYLEELDKNKKSLDKIGLTVNQTHAPYAVHQYQRSFYAEILQRAVKASAFMGAKNMIIHADIADFRTREFSAEAALDEAYDFFAPVVESAKKLNLNIAVENLFEESQHQPRVRFTSTVEEQLSVITKFNDKNVSACWDFGHGRVSYGDKQLEALKKVSKYLISTHVHDNFAGKDLHQNLFLGGTNWEEVMKTLNEIEYKGDFTFEMVYGCIPCALIEKYMKLFYETGEYLLNIR